MIGAGALVPRGKSSAKANSGSAIRHAACAAQRHSQISSLLLAQQLMCGEERYLDPRSG